MVMSLSLGLSILIDNISRSIIKPQNVKVLFPTP